jgi:hypothetical protein
MNGASEQDIGWLSRSRLAAAAAVTEIVGDHDTTAEVIKQLWPLRQLREVTSKVRAAC